MKALQPWIELSSSEESEWVAARYDSGAMPPGVASRVLKLDSALTQPKPSSTAATTHVRSAHAGKSPTLLSDWQRLVRWMNRRT
jgi:hypothetical protein